MREPSGEDVKSYFRSRLHGDLAATDSREGARSQPHLIQKSFRWLLLIGALVLSGCVKSEMQFHFASADLSQDQPELKFYRVTVKGESGAETSHLLTGFYNADALHALFGKVEEPKNTGTSGTETSSEAGHAIGSITVEYDPLSHGWRVLNDNEKFTVFWGTNADAMAQQVGAFAESSETGDQMASLLAAAAGRDKFDALRTSQNAAEEKDSSRAKLSDALATLKTKLDTVQDADLKKEDILESLRQAVQTGLDRAGSHVVLPSDPTKAIAEAKLAVDALPKGVK